MFSPVFPSYCIWIEYDQNHYTILAAYSLGGETKINAGIQSLSTALLPTGPQLSAFLQPSILCGGQSPRFSPIFNVPHRSLFPSCLLPPAAFVLDSWHIHGHHRADGHAGTATPESNQEKLLQRVCNQGPWLYVLLTQLRELSWVLYF